ncbi:MAG: PQQ-binding-like beta-propeller repeat protein, partial [Sinobacteraceae bacterium]|nr:PQQ-binding-like beta-propeller repeat protein [Nevskiaceae bacterium]
MNWTVAALAVATIMGAAITAAADSASSPAQKGEWSMPAADYAGTRFSTLAQINLQTATRLRPLWTFSTGVLGGHEGQPLVVNDTMYVVTPWPNVLYAFDLKQEGYPLRWKYRPAVSPNALGLACCDAVNRGAFFADGKVIYNLLDGHTVAVDAKTGRQLWSTQIADLASGETVTMAPFVAKDRVIVAASGGEFGIYGWVKALDLKTGELLWTAHNMGPDRDMLIRPDSFKPSYDHGADLGVQTWAGQSWKNGGGPVWGWVSYDPELDLIFYGTGNAGPYNAEQRAGDNKWTSSVLARRPGDGTLVWAYQFTPHDSWDYDATGAMILADLTI